MFSTIKYQCFWLILMLIIGEDLFLVNCSVHHHHHHHNHDHDSDSVEDDDDNDDNSLMTNVDDDQDDNVDVDSDDWNYWGPHGEHYWRSHYRHCKGRFQSPINIQTDRLVLVPDLQLSLINYDQPLHGMTLINTGHGIMLQPSKETLNSKVQCFAGGSALNNDIYRFLQFHFHWRYAHTSGSEHAIDGKKFTMEMHLVHQNVKYEKQQSLIGRILIGDLYLVIAVFFNETNQHNPTLNPIIEKMDNVINVHKSYTLNKPIHLNDFLPNEDFLNKFYRYYGSYTTPDCQEIVTWIIFKQPLDISHEQMDKFRQLLYNITRHQQQNPSIRKKFRQRYKNAFAHKYKLRKNIHRLKPAILAAAAAGKNNDKTTGNPGQDDDEEDEDETDDNKDEQAKIDEETIGYYRHIQELGSRKIYAPLTDSAELSSHFTTVIIIVIIIINTLLTLN